MKRKLHSFVAMLLVACMVAGVLPVTVLAAEREPPVFDEEIVSAELVSNEAGDGSADDGKLVYVSFGDSMTNGYGLSGYALPNGVGVNGFLQESPVAYPAMYADYLAEQTGKEVDLIQLAVSGMQVEDLTFILNYEWKQDWENAYNELDSKYTVHRYRKMTYEEFMSNYAKYGMGDYHTYDHFVDGKSDDLNGNWLAYANAYFCAECGRTFYGTYYNGTTSGFTPDICEHYNALSVKAPWSGGYTKDTEHTWSEVTIPENRGDVYFYSNESNNLKANMNGNIWFGNAMAAYAGQFQTAVKDADVISLGVGNANFGVYLLSRMISAMGVLTGFGADDYCWDKEKGCYDPTLIDNYDYYGEDGDGLKPIIEKENDPLMLAMCDLAEDIVKKNIGTVVEDYMGVTDEDNIFALENIMLYSTISFMRSYGMMLDRIAELNPDAEVIIVGLMNAFSDTTMIMDDGTELNLDATFEELFGLLNIYLTTLASLKHANDPAHADITYKYAEEATVDVLADVFYTEDQGIYAKDNVIRDRFIESVCNQVFYLMGGALVDNAGDSILPGGMELVKVDRVTVEAYEEFAAKWAVDRSTPLGMTTSQMFSSAVYLGFERAIAEAGQSGRLYMSAIKETSNGFDTVFAPIASALGSNLVTSDDMTEINNMMAAEIGAWAASNQQSVGSVMVTYGITDTTQAAQVAFAINVCGANITNVSDKITAYATNKYAPYFVSANITDALYNAVMPTDENPDETFETLLNMFARMVIGDGLGQHPSVSGHEELFKAISEEQVTAQAHSQAALDGAIDGYVADIKAVTEELMADANYAAATTGEYTTSAGSYYLALSDGKLTGYEADLAAELYGEGSELYSVIANGSLRADDLLWLLMDDAVGDAYFTDVAVPSLYDIAGDYDEDEDTDIEDVRAYVKAEVEKADLITVSVGPSSVAFANAAAELEIPTNEQWEMYLGEEYAAYAEKLLGTAGNIAGEEAAAMLPMLEALVYCNLANKVTYPALLDQIHAINPDAQIVALGYYDSMWTEEDDMEMMGFSIPVGQVYSALNVEGDNIVLEYAIEHNGYTTYVKVRDDSAFNGYGNVKELVLAALKIGHQHNLDTNSWSFNETHHWRACTTPGCSGDYANIEGSDYGEHGFTVNSYTCECGYVQGVSPVISNTLTDATYTYGKDTAGALTVEVTVPAGGSLSYQWYSKNDDNENGEAINGATDSSYTPAIDAIGTTYYYCVVTNTYEGKAATATTPVVKIEVIAVAHAEVPTITTQPVSAGYLDNAVEVAALTVEASVSDGGTLSYQWYSNSENSTEGGTLIEGATNSSYTPPLTEGTLYYYCVVTNTNAGEGITGETTAKAVSNVAEITVTNSVNAAPPVISKNPKSAAYVQGAEAEPLSVKATVADSGTLSYQWYDSNGEISGAADSSYTPDTSEVGTFEYYCVVTNTNDGVNGTQVVTTTSSTAIIEVEEPVNAEEPVIVTHPASPGGIYAVGADADQLFVEARVSDGGTLSYQWYDDNGAIDGATSRFYTPDTGSEGTFEYYCMVTNTNEAATGDEKVVSVYTDRVTVCVKDLAGDMESIVDSVLALANITDTNAGSELDSILADLKSEYAEQINSTASGTYYVNDSNVFLALGGTTAKAADTYVDLTADGLEIKGADNGVIFEFSVDNNAQTDLSALDMASYIENNKAAIKYADIITYQVEASSFVDYMLDTTKGTPTWPSKYSEEETLVDGYLDTLEASIEDQLEANLNSFIASTAITNVKKIVLPMVERLMYAATVYFHETADAMATIREYNPDALIVAVGMNNPVYGMDSLSINGAISLGLTSFDIDADLGFDFDSIFAQVIQAADMNTILAALQDTTGNTIYVALPNEDMINSDKMPKSIDVNDALETTPLTEFKSQVSAAMVVTASGQESIASSIINAVTIGKLSNTEDEEDDLLAGFEAAFKAVSLTLTDNITINFKAAVTEGAAVDYEVGALFWTSEPENDDYTVYGEPELVIDQNSDSYGYEAGTGRHVFSFNDIAAKEMNDTIYAVVYVKAGNEYVYSNPLEYSVVKAAKAVLDSGNYNTEFKTLAVDMLNYGASAQEYFAYRTGALANEELTNTQQNTYATSGNAVLTSGKVFFGDANEYVKFTSASLLLESAVGLNYKAEAAVKNGVAPVSAVLMYSDDNATWKSKEMELNGSTFEASIDEVVAKEMRKAWYTKVCVTYEDGSVEETNVLKYSVEDYAYDARNLDRPVKDVTNELIKYGDSAAAYFESIG